MTSASKSRAYCMTRRMTRALRIARAPSLNATAPASCNKPISASPAPSRPAVKAATGSTRTRPVSRARRNRKSTTAASSTGGLVSGRARIVVTPPAAAAQVALAILGAGLADERPHVDEARRHAIAAAIDNSRVGGEICRRDGGSNIADQAIDDQDTAHGLAEVRRIDQPHIDERERLVGNGSGGGTFHPKLALIHWANAVPRPPIRRSAPRPPSRPARG